MPHKANDESEGRKARKKCKGGLCCVKREI